MHFFFIHPQEHQWADPVGAPIPVFQINWRHRSVGANRYGDVTISGDWGSQSGNTRETAARLIGCRSEDIICIDLLSFNPKDHTAEIRFRYWEPLR